MKFLTCLLVISLSAGFAFADDPGERDSLIVETVFAELGDSTVDVRIYATCDDSVGFYNMPFAWYSPDSVWIGMRLLTHCCTIRDLCVCWVGLI